MKEESIENNDERLEKSMNWQTEPVIREGRKKCRFNSGRNLQANDWKMRPVVHIGDMNGKVGCSRVELGSLARNTGVMFDRCFSLDALMRSNFVVSIEIKSKFKSHVGLSQRHDDSARAFGFQGTDHSFHDGDASILADGPESGLDFPATAPALEGLAPELISFIGDDVFRGLAGRMNCAAQEGTDLEGIGLVIEDGETDDLPGEVVNDQGDPISKRPALRERKRKPANPETGGSRDNGQVNVPYVVGIMGGDRARRGSKRRLMLIADF